MHTNPSGISVDHTEVVGAAGAQIGGLVERLREDPFDPIAAARLLEIHAARGDWAEVVRLEVRAAELLLERGERAAALCRAAELHRTRLGDPAGAWALAQQALAACPEHPALEGELEAIARSDEALAGEVIEHLAAAAGECALGAPDLAAALWLQIAIIELTARGDEAAALAALRRAAPDALDRRGCDLLDRLVREAREAPGLSLLDAVADLWRRAGDRARERAALARSLELCDTPERVRRLRAVAALLEADGDDEGARWYAREAARLDPRSGLAPAAGDLEHDRDAALLAERYARQGRWHDLEPVIDRLVRPGGLAAERLGLSRADLHFQAGRAALELGKHAKALRHYCEALEYDPVHLDALLDRARAAAAIGKWQEAHDAWGAVLLVQRSHGRPADELADTLHRMGEAREADGAPEAALALFESALDVWPAHPEALAAACRLHREAGDLVAAERLLGRAVRAAGRRRRAALLVELAGLRSRFFADADGAVEMCRQALAIAPGNRAALRGLAEHCQEAGRIEEAIAALGELAAAEPNHLVRGKLHQLAGALAAPRSAEQAAASLSAALDCFFSPARLPPPAMRRGCMAAFRDLVRLLGGRGEWKRLEREYRAMIKRLPAGAPELPRLWAELGSLYRTQLGHGEAAIQSYEVASALERDRLTHHRVLIDLYQGMQADELDKLIDRRLRLVAAEPFNREHYAALRQLWARSRQLDRTFTACRALVFLGAADREEEALFRRHRRERVVWPARPLGEADWARLCHPDENRLLGAVLAMVAEPIAMIEATSARRLRLRDDPSAEHEPVRRLYRQACAALGVGAPALYVLPEMEGDIVLANLRRGGRLAPAFAVGGPMYRGRSDAQMVHTMARALSYARPAAYLRLLFGGAGQLGSVWAAVRGVARRPGATEGVALAGPASRMEEALARRAQQGLWLAEMRSALARLRERSEGPIDLDRWGRGVDATARRAGLLLSGELDVAAADLSREPLFAQRTPRAERLADLLVHSVSLEHHALRRDLGLALE